MHRYPLLFSLFGLLVVQAASAEEAARVPDLNQLHRQRDLEASVHAYSEGALLEQSTAVEQAAAEAQSRSAYSMELRPRLSEEDAGLAFRIYLPDRWSRKKLSERLMLVAQAEQLRVAELEWTELLEVYRDLCAYRMLQKQVKLYEVELSILEPYLSQADLSVQLHQLAVTDRAKLYSLYLDLINDREKLGMERIRLQRRLYLVLGSAADLEYFSETATIDLPSKLELSVLVQQALGNRADLRRLDVEARSITAAEQIARSEDGFRLKYIQPSYSMTHSGDGDDMWAISAAFVLPWGTRNPDIALYQQQRTLTLSAMNLQRKIVEERLQVLIHSAHALDVQLAKRNELITPLLNKLEADLKQIDQGQLEQLRDLMLIRERVLDTALETVKTEYERELIAVDLAEELGTVGDSSHP